MTPDRLSAYPAGPTLDLVAERGLQAARPTDRWAEVGPAGPPHREFWCRVLEDAPGDPPDERYFADEVRPTGVGPGGHLEWEPVPGGLEEIVVHNVVEAVAGTHLLQAGTVIRVEERLDRNDPPELVFVASVTVGGGTDRLARIESYESGAYIVQPVMRTSGGYAADGPPIEGVPNLGELWDAEQGYLAGPASFDRYVRIFQTPAGWAMLVHPPRLV
jgi:hypothetical protein